MGLMKRKLEHEMDKRRAASMRDGMARFKWFTRFDRTPLELLTDIHKKDQTNPNT